MNKALLLSTLMLGSGAAYAQYGIGANQVDASALYQLNSTTKGFLPPRMTYAQRNAINGGLPAEGLIVYQTDNNASPAAPPGLYVYSGGTWSAASAAALAGSGLTANGGRLDLGGTLTAPTTLVATTPNFLTIAGTGGLRADTLISADTAGLGALGAATATVSGTARLNGATVKVPNIVGAAATSLIGRDANNDLVTVAIPIDSTTASNGLTEVSNDIQLGGFLTQNTTITTGDSSLSLNGANANDEVLNVTNNLPGTMPPVSTVAALEAFMNYSGTETGNIPPGQATTGSRVLSQSSSQKYQAQGASFEGRATSTSGGSGDYHAVGLLAVGTSSTASATVGSRLTGLQAGAGLTTTSSHDWDVVGIEAFTSYANSTTTRRTVAGHFDGYGGAGASLGIIGTVDGILNGTFDDPSLVGKNIGVVASNTNGGVPGGIDPGVSDFALYGIGAVRLMNQPNPGNPTAPALEMQGGGLFLTDGDIQTSSDLGAETVGVNMAAGTAKSLLEVAGSFGAAINVLTNNAGTLDANHHTVIFNAGGDADLPTPSSATRRVYVLVNRTATPVDLTLTYNPISGAATSLVPANTKISVQSDGGDWYQID